MGDRLSQYVTRVRLLWATLSLVTITTLILVACGGGGTTAQSTPTATTAPTTAPTATSPSQSSPTSTGKPVMIKIVEKSAGVYSFDPLTVSIKKGTEVIWTNTTGVPHTVTSDTGAFNTPGNLMTNQTFMTTFSTAGVFTYHCNIHLYMKAVINVTA